VEVSEDFMPRHQTLAVVVLKQVAVPRLSARLHAFLVLAQAGKMVAMHLMALAVTTSKAEAVAVAA
jgi:hypothetical protein